MELNTGKGPGIVQFPGATRTVVRNSSPPLQRGERKETEAGRPVWREPTDKKL